nr:MAG TPA: hypothetical protein [Caudoviricetes sp.]
MSFLTRQGWFNRISATVYIKSKTPLRRVFSFMAQAKNCILTVKRISLRPEFFPLVLRGFTAIEGDRCPNQ